MYAICWITRSTSCRWCLWHAKSNGILVAYGIILGLMSLTTQGWRSDLWHLIILVFGILYHYTVVWRGYSGYTPWCAPWAIRWGMHSLWGCIHCTPWQALCYGFILHPDIFKTLLYFSQVNCKKFCNFSQDLACPKTAQVFIGKFQRCHANQDVTRMLWKVSIRTGCTPQSRSIN